MTKNILVCGGSGFIGSNFTRYLLDTHPDYRVFNLDLQTYAGNNGNLSDLANHQRYAFVRGDICDEKLLGDLFSKQNFDIVANFAAETHVDRSIFNSAAFIHTNVNGVYSLITACRKYETSRFIQISTDEVYGNVAEGHSTEESPLNPSNPYSASKAAADLLIISYMNTFKFPAIIVRGSNNFGPFQYPEKLIPLAIVNLITGGKIPIHGTGDQIRSWLHVLDFCKAIDLIMHKGLDNSIYNVSGIPKRNIEVLQKIAAILGKDLDYQKFHTKDRPGGDLRYSPDSSKIRKELEWIPQYNFDSHIEEVVHWYERNQGWWEKILGNKDVWDHYQKQFKAHYY